MDTPPPLLLSSSSQSYLWSWQLKERGREDAGTRHHCQVGEVIPSGNFNVVGNQADPSGIVSKFNNHVGVRHSHGVLIMQGVEGETHITQIISPS